MLPCQNKSDGYELLASSEISDSLESQYTLGLDLIPKVNVCFVGLLEAAFLDSKSPGKSATTLVPNS